MERYHVMGEAGRTATWQRPYTASASTAPRAGFVRVANLVQVLQDLEYSVGPADCVRYNFGMAAEPKYALDRFRRHDRNHAGGIRR